MDLLTLYWVRSRLVRLYAGVLNQIRGFLIKRGSQSGKGRYPLIIMSRPLTLHEAAGNLARTAPDPAERAARAERLFGPIAGRGWNGRSSHYSAPSTRRPDFRRWGNPAHSLTPD